SEIEVRMADLHEAPRIAVVAVRALQPPRFLGRLRSDEIFVDAPLARSPLNDLVGGTSEVARDAVVQRGGRTVRRSEALRLVVAGVLWTDLASRADTSGAVGVARQHRPGGKVEKYPGGDERTRRPIRDPADGVGD